MLTSSTPRGTRNRVDLSSTELTRQWRKHFGTSKEKIEAAIAKVGDNPESVQKQLRAEAG